MVGLSTWVIIQYCSCSSGGYGSLVVEASGKKPRNEADNGAFNNIFPFLFFAGIRGS